MRDNMDVKSYTFHKDSFPTKYFIILQIVLEIIYLL